MKIVSILAAMALTTGAIGVSAASARPHHPRHKVCRTTIRHHHRVTHCFWR